ncbi:neuroepithelial cell-transforming gene 1 protein-like [Salarias fasciatus]|uniref:neuroepithelial cell-transforming gene 1 protein-like n=1 Tax=Salarias fasciatus TaxID=181472 RepID=UPI001176ED62|nr:neuroepithelial cell-transforming gene 1 protein-like [Salarias fasciatus]
MGEPAGRLAPAPRSENPQKERKFPPEEEEGSWSVESRCTSLRRSLRRGGSCSFLTPGPRWDSSPKRKRRAKDECDAVSLCSFDFKAPSCLQIRRSVFLSNCSVSSRPEFPRKMTFSTIEQQLSGGAGRPGHAAISTQTQLIQPRVSPPGG